MTRRDFELIARIIAATAVRFSSNSAHARFATDMAVALADTNPRFDKARFIRAAMPAWMVGTRHANPWEREARRPTEPNPPPTAEDQRAAARAMEAQTWLAP